MFGKILLAVAGIFGAVKLMNVGQTKRTADKLMFTPTAAKWKGFKSGSVNFDVIVTVVNPTSANMTINYVFADIFLPGGTKITSLNIENWNKVVKKEATSELIIPVKLFITDLFFLGWKLLNAFKSGKMPKTLQAKGFIRVNKLTVEFDEIITVIK